MIAAELDKLVLEIWEDVVEGGDGAFFGSMRLRKLDGLSGGHVYIF
jgi:hypothetical protein